jgi:hypothetical protein
LAKVRDALVGQTELIRSAPRNTDVKLMKQSSKSNQAFLHARFALGEDVLEPYKASIDRWVCPDVGNRPEPKMRRAAILRSRLHLQQKPPDRHHMDHADAQGDDLIAAPGDAPFTRFPIVDHEIPQVSN